MYAEQEYIGEASFWARYQGFDAMKMDYESFTNDEELAILHKLIQASTDYTTPTRLNSIPVPDSYDGFRNFLHAVDCKKVFLLFEDIRKKEFLLIEDVRWDFAISSMRLNFCAGCCHCCSAATMMNDSGYAFLSPCRFNDCSS